MKVQAFSSYDTVSIEKWDCGDMENVRIDELRRLDNPSIHQLVFCARLHGKIIKIPIESNAGVI